MVLADLGNKLSSALRSLSSASVVDEKVVKSLTSQIAMALLQSDVDVRLVKALQTSIQAKANPDDMPPGTNKRKLIQGIVINEIIALLDSEKKAFVPKKGQPNVFITVGLQGAGKTTSCTKLAYHYKKKGWKTAVVCADTFRAGAFDQLKQNCTKAKIPFYGSYTETDPAVIAEDGVDQFKEQRYEIIIVDTSGRHKQEAALFTEMQQVVKVTQPDTCIFVMDGSIGQAARLQAEAFRDAVDIGSVLLTKLDGHAKGGGALSAVAATKSPIIFIGTGEKIEDLEPFVAKSFVSRLLGMGDVEGLLNLFQESKVFDADAQKELLDKLTKEGRFTFRDMYNQFNQLLSMGPLGQVMNMIPGLSNMLGKGQEADAQKRIQRFMTILDSMTQEELDSTTKLFQAQKTRIVRVARGSGSSIRQVEELFATFAPFANMAKSMKGFGKGGRMPTAQSMANMLPPGMIEKMGGMGAISAMMKQMQQGGGMPGFPGMPGMPGMPK